MIVSGFTQKSVREEHLHGSPLDHTHCTTCISRSCRAPTDKTSSCDMVDCPRGCLARYHHCKDSEHALLCPEERVACINSIYGCPLVLRRRKLLAHIVCCPASIVYCNAEWNRCNLEPAKPGETPPILMNKVYSDCAQLDTALALRDHRYLVDLFEASQQSNTVLRNPQTTYYPAVPLGRVHSATLEHDGSYRPWESPIDQLMKGKSAAEKKTQLYDVTQQTATALTSTLTYISERIGSSNGGVSRGSSEAEESSTLESPANKTGSADTENKSGEGTVPSHEGSSSIKDRWESMLQHGQAVRSIMSVNLSVQCIARYQPKTLNTYTFHCAQEVRRDEFSHHFDAVHNRIQSEIGCWMEQRCPLAYLGCPYSFRRLRPNVPDMTICHSWLLESFGVTHLSPETDFSHTTPSHVMPVFPETADSHIMPGATLEAQVHPRNGPTSSKSIQSTEQGLKVVSVSPVENQGNDSMTAADKDKLSSERVLSVLEMPDSYHKPSLSNPGELDSFSALLDGICLDDPCTPQKPNQEHCVGPTNISSQASGVNSDSDTAGNRNQSDHHVPHTTETISSSLSTSTHVIPHVQHSLPTWNTAQSFSRSHDAGSNRGGQVIYTGAGADSCVRLDFPSQLSNTQASLQSNTQENNMKHIPQENVSFVQQHDRPSETMQPLLKVEDSKEKPMPPETALSQHEMPTETVHPLSNTQDNDARPIPSQSVSSQSAPSQHDMPTDTHPLSNSQDNDDKPVPSQSEPSLQLYDMPSEIMRHITQFLDSFSLYNLSLVSRSMRDLCCSLLQERGMVALVWQRQEEGDRATWRVVAKRWSFSTSCEGIDSWKFTGHNPIPQHLLTCPYNQDRVQHPDKFSLTPLCESPLSDQIRDRLQQLMQQRRDFRGWIIYSNFERYLVSQAQPMVGPFADVLVALGGTLPP